MSYAVSSTVAQTDNAFTSTVSVSSDGRFVAYIDQAGGAPSVVKILDTQTGLTRSLGDEVDALRKQMPMSEVKISGDGHSVVFTLADYKTTQVSIIAHVDLRSGELHYVSTPIEGTAWNGGSHNASVSNDGRFVAFQSNGSNLVTGDTNGATDVFVKDMLTGMVRRVSTDAGGNQMAVNSDRATISGDGKSVLFNASAINPGLPQGGGFSTAYVKNLETGALLTVGAPTGVSQRASVTGVDISADGHYALFIKEGSFALPGNPYGSLKYDAELVRQDLLTGATESVSAPLGTARYSPASGSLSDDGRAVLFDHLKEFKYAEKGTVPVAELYVRDMSSGTVNPVSFESGNGWGTRLFSLSGDGAHAVYTGNPWLFGGADAPPFLPQVYVATLLADSGATASTTLARETYLPQQRDQSVNGGVGLDTAVYRGKAAEYTVKLGSATVSVTDQQAGRDGVDVLSNIERIRFSDGALAFDKDGNAGQAFRIYQAAFDRTPDAAGLGYWINRLDAGDKLDDIAVQFVNSAEFTALYGKAPTNAQFVNKLYQNILHRPGDAAGVAYWNEVLDHKQTNAADVLASFSESAENVAALVGVMDHGIAYTYQPPALWLAQ